MLLLSQELCEKYSRTEQTDECGWCAAKEGANHQQTVCRWPQILILQLARFSVDESLPLKQRAASSQKVSCIHAVLYA